MEGGPLWPLLRFNIWEKRYRGVLRWLAVEGPWNAPFKGLTIENWIPTNKKLPRSLSL